MSATADAELGFIPDKAQDLGFVPDKPNSPGFVPDTDSYGNRNDGNFSVEAPTAAPLVNGLVSTPLNLGPTSTTATGAPPAPAVPALASTIVPPTNQQPAMGARIINAAAPPSPAQATQTDLAPSKINDALNTPLWNYLPPDMKSALSPADFMREVAAKNPSDKFFSALAGSASGLGNTAQAFTSPLALSMFPMAGVSPAAQKAIGIAFGAQMVAQNPDIGTQLGEEMGKPANQRDTAKIAQLITEGFANSTLAGLMVKHALPDVGFKPDVESLPSNVEATAPNVESSSQQIENPPPATIASKAAANPTAPITLADLAQLQQEMRNNQGAALLKSKEVAPVSQSAGNELPETTASNGAETLPAALESNQGKAQPQSTNIHGGAQEDLPAAQQAQSIANNSPDAWAQMRAATGIQADIPLGLNRPSIQNPALKNLSDEDFDAEFMSAKQSVNSAEKGMDDAFDAGKELTPQQKQSIAAAQDRWTAADLERFRRNTQDIVPEDLFYKLKNLAGNAVKFGEGSDDYQKAKIIMAELSRQGATPEQMLSSIRLTSPDAAEVFKADLEDIKNISQSPAKGLGDLENPTSTETYSQRFAREAYEARQKSDADFRTKQSGNLKPKENLPSVVQRLGRQRVSELIGEWEDGAVLTEDGKGIKAYADPRNKTGLKKVPHTDFLNWLSENETQSPTSRPGVENTKNAPESKQNSVQPVADTAQTPVQSDSGTHGIAARVLETRATAGDIDPIETGEGISPQASVEHGRELLRQAKDPLASFSDLTANRPLSDQVAIARARSEQLQKAADAAYDKSGADSDEYKAAKKANQDWAEQTKTLATESHKAMMAHQGEVDLNTGDFHALRQAHLEATGRDFEPAQEKKARAIADESKQSDSDVEKAKSKLYDTLGDAIGRKTTASEHVVKIAESIVKKLDERADASRKELQKIWGRTSAGVDPTIVGHLANIAASHIGHVGLDFAKWSDAMIKQFGEKARPYLEKAWAAAQNKQELKGKAPKPKTDVQTVWQHAKKNYLDKGVNDFGKLVNGTAVDLGIKTADVRRLLAQPKGAKVLTDEMYGKMAEQRRIQNSAKSWLKDQQQNTILKYGGKIPKAFFSAKVIGHGTVGMITHAGNQMFDPRAAKDYWTNFIRQYPMAFGKSGAYHEMMMEDLQHHPLYNKAKRAGLVIDPHKFADDYQTAPMIKYFGQIGNRGFDALKLYRMTRFAHEWDNLPVTLKTKEMASLISDSVNHSTGVVKASIPKGLQSTATTLLFAPKLEASRWMFAVAEPAKAAGTVANWRNATPEMKRQAMSEVKQKAVMIGTYFAALAANQGLLSAMGSNQKVNFTDPKKQDWLDFKVAGHNVGIVSPFKSMVRLFSKELHAVFGKRSNFEKLQGDRLEQAGGAVESYGRGKLSPFAGAVADSIARHDYAGNTLPWSNEKPKYKDSTHLTYGQYAAHQFLPIPLEDGMKEVWASKGMGDSMAKTALKAVLTAAAVGGTGARVTDDVQK